MKNENYSSYNGIILAGTSIFIFMLWAFLQTIKIPVEWENYKIPFYIITYLIEFFGSYGFYKSLVCLLHKLVKNVICIKKKVLGNSYLNGIWIGYYVGVSGEMRYIVEYYEQDLEDLNIRGEAYTQDLEFHSKWISTSTNIMQGNGQLIYTYMVEGSNENTNNIGCADLSFKRDSSKQPPYALLGYSVDVQFGKRVPNYERRLSKNEIKQTRNYIEIAKKEFSDDPYHLRNFCDKTNIKKNVRKTNNH